MPVPSIRRLMIRGALGALVLSTLVGASGRARAEPRDGVPLRVVRARAAGARSATFHAEPAPLAQGTVAVIEIASRHRGGTVHRWRCVAVDDVSECLGRPVEVPYLPHDRAMELSVRLVSERGPRVAAGGRPRVARARPRPVQASLRAGRWAARTIAGVVDPH